MRENSRNVSRKTSSVAHTIGLVLALASNRSRKLFAASVTILHSVSQAQQTKRYLVSGSVQGVGFRYFTQHAAAKLHLSGYVRNLHDGRVEVFASGTPEQLEHLRAQLERGPRFANVHEVREEDAAPDGRFSSEFVITHDD